MNVYQLIQVLSKYEPDAAVVVAHNRVEPMWSEIDREQVFTTFSRKNRPFDKDHVVLRLGDIVME